jgi:hypothetical protein
VKVNLHVYESFSLYIHVCNETHFHALANEVHATVEVSVRFYRTNAALVHANEGRVCLKVYNPKKSYYLRIFFCIIKLIMTIGDSLSRVGQFGHPLFINQLLITTYTVTYLFIT